MTGSVELCGFYPADQFSRLVAIREDGGKRRVTQQNMVLF
jgi:hypothetical protein